MASHGKILDLFDNRQLNIQDVQGNVEPYPALVPYEDYGSHIVVYKMETDHDVFMGIIQDFTDRFVRQDGRELWTWLVQWRVEGRPTDAQIPKRPKLWTDAIRLPQPEPPRRKTQAYTSVERRWLDPELVQEEDLLRALLDIVQADSKLVPNYVELLYQTIDYYEGDGFALKCALHQEIPSLWDFENLPVALAVGENADARNDDMEESERSKYREKRIGIQAPDMKEPLTPLMNMPLDEPKRWRYYAACFKSRARAINLLLNAGLNLSQIANYVLDQEKHPLDTPKEGKGHGLFYCFEEEGIWERYNAEKARERKAAAVEKYREPLTSDNLDLEAEQAAYKTWLESTDLSNAFQPDRGSESEDRPPLIPPTPTFRPDLSLTLPRRDVGRSEEEEEEKEIDPITEVPFVFNGLLKSELFSKAMNNFKSDPHGDGGDRDWSDVSSPSASTAWGGSDDEDNDDDVDGDGDGDGNNSEDDDEHMENDLETQLNWDEEEMMDIDYDDIEMFDEGSSITSGDATSPPDPAVQPLPTFSSYIQSLTPEQIAALAPMMNDGLQQTLRSHQAMQTPGHQLSNTPGGTTLGAVSPDSGVAATANLPHRPLSTIQGMHPGSSIHMPPPAVSSAHPLGYPFPLDAASNPFAIQQPPLQGQTSSSSFPAPMPATFASPSQNLTAPAPPGHTALSPGLQNLSFGDGPTSSQGVRASHPPPLTLMGTNTPHLPPPSTIPHPIPNITISPPRPGIQRARPPSPIKTQTASLTALSTLAALGSPVPPTCNGLVPVLIYYPSIISNSNSSHTANPYTENTDALMLGYLQPGETAIELTRAIFLPVQISHVLMRRIKAGGYAVLESYPAMNMVRGMRGGVASQGPKSPHEFAYERLGWAFGMMSGARRGSASASGAEREREVTKRWRVTPGMMTEKDRGAVWEGWGVSVERAIGLGPRARRGAIVNADLTGQVKKVEEDEISFMRRMEMKSLEDEWL